jgi:hypothetical protein
MSTEDRVKALEGEFKLIKSELRQTLISVRDFLLDQKLPSSQDEASGSSKKSGSETTINIPQVPEVPEVPEIPPLAPVEEMPQEQPPGQTPGMPEIGAQSPAMSPMGGPMAYPGMAPMQAQFSPDAAMSGKLELPLDIDTDLPDVSSGDMPDEEPRGKRPRGRHADDEDLEGEEPLAEDAGAKETRNDESEAEDESREDTEDQPQESNQPAAQTRVQPGVPTAPPVNILANLVRWVALARKEIGIEHLPIFLEIYATGGTLTPEMKDVILHLADVAADPRLDPEPSAKTHLINEQMDICMELNNFSGQMPEDLKDKVRRLTELILQQTAYTSKADVWSRLLLELHGVLTDSGTSLMPAPMLPGGFKMSTPAVRKEEPGKGRKNIPARDAEEDETESEAMDDLDDSDEETESEEDAEEADEEEDDVIVPKASKPARLRLVLPVDEHSEQELDLGSLFISTDFPQRKGNKNKN